MGQPVRKIIQENHPEVNIHPFYTLLVDGNSLLFKCFKDNKVNTSGVHIGGVYQFLLHLKIMLTKQPYDYVYVFFDNEDSGILRYQFYPLYKANRDKNYAEHTALSEYAKKYNETLNNMRKYIFEKKPTKVEDGEPINKEKAKNEYEEFVNANFDRERDILCNYFNELFIRWEIDSQTEGDDLISYYVHHKKPEERIVIMSGDQDLTQLINDTVCVYDLNTKKYLSHKNFKQLKGFPPENVVLKKIFLGDTSDNIGNIRGVSEDRLIELMPEINERPVTVDEVKERAKLMCEQRIAEKKKPLQWHENIINGVSNKQYEGDFYDINNRLINLSTPLLTEKGEADLVEMMYTVQDPSDRSLENLYRLILEDDITDLRSSNAFANFFEPFNTLINKEKERYNKEFLRK